MKIPDLDKWCLGNADCNWVAWRDADYHNPEDVKKFRTSLIFTRARMNQNHLQNTDMIKSDLVLMLWAGGRISGIG